MRSTKPVAAFAPMVCVLVMTVGMPRAVSAQTLQVIHSFSGPHPSAESNDGAYPRSALVRGPDGSLYGTTTDFPTGTIGTIFRIPLSGAKETLFNFAGPHPPSLQPGCFPGWNWSLFLASDGAFYSTAGCGAVGDGTLFRITPGGAFTKLHDFDVDGSGASNGGVEGGVVQGSDGNFYGVTGVGAFGFGKIYRLNPDGSITTIHDFVEAEGWNPRGSLLLATDGNLYGVAQYGGVNGAGSIFRLLPDGNLTVVHSFNGVAGSFYPTGNLIQGRDGHLYGTTGPGGWNGTAFRLTLDGVMTHLHTFSCTEGCAPEDGLMEGEDGNLYGTTTSGGSSNRGTIFRLTPAGDVTVLHHFTGPEGSRPFGGLVQASDGHLYGTTHYGGDNNLGVVFRLLLPPDVTLRSPNGGEKVFVGSPWTTRWDVVRATSIDVELSTNGGASYAPIAECTGLAGSATSCAWTPAGPATTNARVRVIAHGGAGETATDASDASFAISNEVPSLAVTTPNTAVTWIVGSTQQIKWSHNVGAKAFVQIDVSRDGGGSWAPVAPPVKNTSAKSGALMWTVTGPATSTALVRVSWLDGPLADVSNVPFTIRQPTVTVTSPTSAGSWAVGGTRTITWTHDIAAGGRVNLDVSRDGGASWSSIATGVANATSRSGTLNWIVTGPVTAAARIRVAWELDPAVSDASNVNFALVEPVITVSGPNTAVKWRVGNTQILKFDHNLGPGQAVSLELTRDDGTTWEPLTVVTTAAGTSTSYSWSVTGPPTSNARVRARWEGNPAVFDDSNVSFTILPRVTVTAPNKNVAWTIGSTQSITWIHNIGVPEAVNIDLSRDGGATWESIATGVPNASATSGAFSWVVTGPPTTLAMVRVGWPADPAASDVSNIAFRIQ